jgi:hypothetical protein
MHVHKTYTTESEKSEKYRDLVIRRHARFFLQNSQKYLLLQITLPNAGRSQVVQRVGSGRREPLVVAEEAAAAATAEPPLSEAGEAAPANSRN